MSHTFLLAFLILGACAPKQPPVEAPRYSDELDLEDLDLDDLPEAGEDTGV